MTNTQNPVPTEMERFKDTNPRATLLDGFLYFREEDVANFLSSHTTYWKEVVREVETQIKDEDGALYADFEQRAKCSLDNLEKRLFNQGLQTALAIIKKYV